MPTISISYSGKCPGGGGVGTSYDGLFGDAPPERRTFSEAGGI